MHESNPCPIGVKSKKWRDGEAAALLNPWESLQLEWEAVPTMREAQQPWPPTCSSAPVIRSSGDESTVPSICSVQFSCSVVSDSLRPHGLQHARPPCPTPTPGVYSNSRLSSRWYHPTISSSVVPLSSRLQSFPTLGSFQMSQFFTSGGQSIRASASASVLPVSIQDWFLLGWTGLISLQSKGLSRVFSSTTVRSSDS